MRKEGQDEKDSAWISSGYIPQQCTRLAVHQFHLPGFWRRVRSNLGSHLLHGEQSTEIPNLARWPRAFLWAG